MVKLSKLYTRTGDDGTTGLIGGARTSKASLRIDAVGDVDELNAQIGAVRTTAEEQSLNDLVAKLEIIQNELFDLGAALAVDPQNKPNQVVEITERQVTRLERWLDEITETLSELTSFVVPGGTELNARFHIARTVCRRAERSIIKLSDAEEVAPTARAYINRLSDLLFAFAREDSKREDKEEYLWKPAGTQGE